MRNSFVHGQFQHLGVDHDELAALRRQAVEQRQDHGVDANRLAGAGGAGNQHVRHAGEIGEHRLAADILAECQRQIEARLLEGFRGQHLAQVDRLALGVWQFDADGIAALHHGDAGRDGAHRAGDIVSQADDARRLDARCRFELIKCNDRTRTHLDDLALDAEIVQHPFEHAGILLQRFVREISRLADTLGFGKQRQRRELILIGLHEAEARLHVLFQFLAWLQRLVGAGDLGGGRLLLFGLLLVFLVVGFGFFFELFLLGDFFLFGDRSAAAGRGAQNRFDAGALLQGLAADDFGLWRQPADNVVAVRIAVVIRMFAALPPCGPACAKPADLRAQGSKARRAHSRCAAALWCRAHDSFFASQSKGAEAQSDGCGEHEASGDQGCQRSGNAETQDHEDEIVNDITGIAAKTCDQSPACGNRQGGQRGTAGQNSAEPGGHGTHGPGGIVMRQKANRPAYGKGDEGQDAKPQELHKLIGERRTGIAEQILGRAIERMIERGIVDRPGGQCDTNENQNGEEQDTRQFEQPLLEEDPHGGGNRAVIGIKGWIIRHANLQPGRHSAGHNKSLRPVWRVMVKAAFKATQKESRRECSRRLKSP